MGQLLDAVTSAGVSHDTTIWFAGDHGANTAGGASTNQYGSASIFGGEWTKSTAWQSAHPGGLDSQASSAEGYYDTAKASTWEGGHRTAAIVWAPGLVEAGRTIMELTTSLDIFVTTLSLAGIPLPTDRVLDGKDITPLLRGDAGAKSPHDWFFYYTTCGEPNGCPAANLTKGLPSDRIAAVRDAQGPMKAHFFTHSGQGAEQWVRHEPPLVFNVERDPGEKEPVLDDSGISGFDGPDCRGKGCLAKFIAAARAAVVAKDEEVVWCEHCAKDGVQGRSMLTATAGDWTVMDCRGLAPAQSGCCEREGGRCAPLDAGGGPNGRE